MSTPTVAQIDAAVAAAHGEVTKLTSFNISGFISDARFRDIITEIVSAALNVGAEPLPNQPLAP